MHQSVNFAPYLNPPLTKMLREIINCGLEVTNKIPLARRIIPGSVWKYLSGNDVINCNKPTKPDLRKEGESPPGVGTTTRRCFSYKSATGDQNGEVGHVGRVENGRPSCCSEGCLLFQIQKRK